MVLVLVWLGCGRAMTCKNATGALVTEAGWSLNMISRGSRLGKHGYGATNAMELVRQKPLLTPTLQLIKIKYRSKPMDDRDSWETDTSGSTGRR